MTAYLIGDITVTEPRGYEEYRQAAPETVLQYGGRYLTKAGTVQPAEGGWTPDRFVILEFPTMHDLTAWWESPEYRPLRALRERCAESRIVFTEGM